MTYDQLVFNLMDKLINTTWINGLQLAKMKKYIPHMSLP